MFQTAVLGSGCNLDKKLLWKNLMIILCGMMVLNTSSKVQLWPTIYSMERVALSETLENVSIICNIFHKNFCAEKIASPPRFLKTGGKKMLSIYTSRMQNITSACSTISAHYNFRINKWTFFIFQNCRRCPKNAYIFKFVQFGNIRAHRLFEK